MIRFARHVSLAEIGTVGQQRLETAAVREGQGDPRAIAIAIEYLARAGVRHDASGEPLDVREHVDRVAGRPELREAAAFLLGALAATDRIASITGAGARPVARIAALAGDDERT